ncbi:GNAT family N-acetyltransferase [Holzapfeliella sp. He02]|uniref:GNAT family N-acetyltransferase n=1 Tax=Holzapfeliella saturejae TaxID=3082953 RepID=A0ABU8SHL5_9LACO
MKVEIKETAELTPAELLTILKERTKVFVVEQKSPYQEVDDWDNQAIHVMFWTDNHELAAYARILNKGDFISFGRVLVTRTFRKQKLGKKLVQTVLDEINQRFPNQLIQIAAQSYLQKFYGSFGFQVSSPEYLEDNIPHINMILK